LSTAIHHVGLRRRDGGRAEALSVLNIHPQRLGGHLRMGMEGRAENPNEFKQGEY
jgi:hypothetical protein